MVTERSGDMGNTFGLKQANVKHALTEMCTDSLLAVRVGFEPRPTSTALQLADSTLLSVPKMPTMT